jgi:hypothetical protein
VNEVLQQALAYLGKPGNENGGSLHIALEDGNMEYDHVQFCLGYAQGNGEDDGELLARSLLNMTEAQRFALYEALWER